MQQTRLESQWLSSSTSKVRSAVLAAIAILAMVLLYRKGLVSLADAWSRPEYSHGYFILPLAIYLVLRQWKSAPDDDSDDEHRGLTGSILAGTGTVLGLLGDLASVPDIVTYGMLFAIAGLFVAFFGPKRSLVAWPAWIYLWFMLPLPNMFYWPLSIKLQYWSSELGAAMVQLLGIPVFLDGNIIDLGNYQLQVAEACSGLRYLFPLMSFGFLFATLYDGKVLSKAIIFLSSIPITIAMNSFRIAVVSVLVSAYGQEQADGFLHFFEGWIVFVACLILLFGVALLMKLAMRDGQPGGPLIDLPFAGLLPDFAFAWPVLRYRDLLTSLLIIIGAAAIALAFTLRPATTVDRLTLDRFPMSLGDLDGRRQFLDRDILFVLGADDYLMADYSGTTGAPPTSLLVSYYVSQTNGSGIHSPEVCIPAGGWEVSNWSRKEISVPGTDDLTIEVNQAIIQKGLDRQLVYYWFEQGGRRVASDYTAKLLTIWTSITRGRSDGALVRLTTPMDAGGMEAAERRLRDFARHVVEKLGAYVPP